MSDRFAATPRSASYDGLPLAATKPAKRLVLFAPNLFGGGAERSLARLATHWAGQERDVTLVTLAPVSPADAPLPASVQRVGLGLTADARGLAGAVRNNLRRVRAVRDTFRASRPDVVVSFIEQANVLALLAARPLDVPVVIGERTDPARHPVGRLWHWLRKRTYPRCAALVVLTKTIAGQMCECVGGRPIVVIPNGVAKPVPMSIHVPVTPDTFAILGVGRLDRAKGFDRLIEAFARIADRHQQWRLVIVGDGPERQRLVEQIESFRLQTRIDLPGHVSNPSPWYARADLFALPSRYEGFPNALLEAMAHGKPVIAFDGPSAVRDVIRDRVDGLLVPDDDVPAFAAALSGLMSDSDRRKRMATSARAIVSRFPLEAFYQRWDAVIDAAAGGDFSQLSGTVSE